MKRLALGAALLLAVVLIVSCGMKANEVPAVFLSAFDKTRKVLPPDGGAVPGSTDGGQVSAGTDGGSFPTNDILRIGYDRVCPVADRVRSVAGTALGEDVNAVLEISIPTKNFRVVIPLDRAIFARQELNFSYVTSVSIPRIDPQEFAAGNSNGNPGSAPTPANDKQFVVSGVIQIVAFDDVNRNGIRDANEDILSQGSRGGVPTVQAGNPNVYLASHNIYANRQVGSSRGNPTELCESYASPLVLDLSGDGFHFSPPVSTAIFDINADGYLDQTGWLSPLANFSNGFLARDIDHNGMIDDGSELFGNHTKLPNGEYAGNGFEGLRALDSNGDGYFDAADEKFSELVIWRDFNLNGVSESYEMQSLSSLQIIRINIKDYINLMEADQYGNLTRQRSSYTRLVDGQEKELQVIDIWFRTGE